MTDIKNALDKFLESSKKDLDRIMEEKREQSKKDKLRRDFEKLDLKQIRKKNESQLILWRSGFSDDSPQYQFATHELDKKKLYRNLRWLAVIALIGASATIFGILYKSKTQIPPQEKTISHTQQETTTTQSPVHNNTNMISPSQPDAEKGKKTESLKSEKKTK